RRSLSGAQPPGTTTASTASAETASTSTSAVASSPFLPCTGWVVSPATVTWAPSSCRRITVTQNSRSSNPSASSTTTLLPSSRPAMSHLQLCLSSSPVRIVLFALHLRPAPPGALCPGRPSAGNVATGRGTLPHLQSDPPTNATRHRRPLSQERCPEI